MNPIIAPEVRNAGPRVHGRQARTREGADKAAYLGVKLAVRAPLRQSHWAHAGWVKDLE